MVQGSTKRIFAMMKNYVMAHLPKTVGRTLQYM